MKMRKREEFGEIFIYFILVFWMSTEVIINTTIEYVFVWKREELNNILAYIILVLLLIQIAFFQNYQLKEIITIGAITGLVVLVTLNSDYNALITTWIFIVASKNIDFDKFIELTYYTQLIMFIVVIYMFLNNYIQDFCIYRDNLLRHSLGFSHPNQLGIRVFLLMVSRCYCRRNKLNAIDIAIVIAAAFSVNKIANSKTSYYALLILAIISVIYVALIHMGSDMAAFSNILILIAITANVGSIVLSTNNIKKIPMLRSFDMLMSKRFSQCYRTMNYYGISLFGQEVKLLVKRPALGTFYHFWLDNAYMAILLRYGVLMFLVFSYLYLVAMVYLKRSEQYYLLGIMSLYSIYGIMENNYFSISQNLFLIVLSFPIYIHITSKAPTIFSSKIRIIW